MNLYLTIVHLYFNEIVCKCDANGASLYFFSGDFRKYDHVKSADEVLKLFKDKKNQMFSSTDLAKVLTDAIKPIGASGLQSAILVIIDGEPNDKKAVEKVLINASKQMTAEGDLSVTLIQVGNDQLAVTWLDSLEVGLKNGGAKFALADTMSHGQLKAGKFVEIVKKSVVDGLH